MIKYWKIIVAAIITILLFILVIGLYVNVSRNAASSTALDFTTKQGVANNEESNRVIKSAGIQTDIASESANDTASRMQQYWDATGRSDSSEYKQTTSLQDSKRVSDIPYRQPSRKKGKVRPDMREEGLLWRAATELLYSEKKTYPVIITGPIEDDECHNPTIVINTQGIVIAHHCDNGAE